MKTLSTKLTSGQKNSIQFQKPNRFVNAVFLHCSASDRPEHDEIDVIRDWHIQRGFSGVGYHYYIRKDGTLELGRDLERIPAAQKSFNTGSIAICVAGLEVFTDKSLRTLKKLCQAINNEYKGEITFHGHCEVNPNKTCPVFDYKTVLNLNNEGFMV